MSSFIESATLKVVDQSSAQINKINSELRKLAATAKSLKSTSVDFKIQTSSITKASAELKRLNEQLNVLKGARSNLNVNSAGLEKATAAAKSLAQALRAASESKVNISAQTGGITKAMEQLKALRAEANRPIRQNIETTPGRGGRRAGATQEPTRPGVAVGVPGGRGILRGALGTAAGIGLYTTGAELIKEMKAGVHTAEAGEASLALKQLSPEHRTEIDKLIKQIGEEQAARPGGAMFQRGAIVSQMSEMLGTLNIGAAYDPKRTKEENEADFRGRAAQAKFMADQNLELAATLVKLGKSSEDAIEDAIKYGKAIDQQGTAYDRVTGKVDTQKLSDAYDRVRQLIPAIGTEMSGANFLAIQKYLRLSKFALSPEATAIVTKSFEEMGTGAAVGMNQFVKSLGATTPPAMAEQARLGLLQGRQVAGKGGKAKTVYEVSDEDAKLIREHPEEYAATRLVPALINDLMKKGATREQAEAKTLDPAFIGTALNKLFPNRTAAEMAGILTLQRNELQQFLNDWRSRSGDLDRQREDTKTSVLGSVAAVSQQTQGVMGAGVQFLAPVINPVMQGISHLFQEGTEKIQTAREMKLPPWQIAAVTTAAVGGVVLGIEGLRKLGPLSPFNLASKAFGAVAEPLGMAAGMAGAANANPAIRSLSLAGISLISAAHELSAAAAALQGKGLLQKAVEGIGGAGIGAWLLKVAGPRALGAAGFYFGSTQPAGEGVTTKIPGLNELNAANQDLWDSTTKLRRAQDDLAAATDPAEQGRLAALIAQAEAAVAAANKRLGEAQKSSFEPVDDRPETVRELHDVIDERNRRERRRHPSPSAIPLPEPRPIVPQEAPAWIKDLKDTFDAIKPVVPGGWPAALPPPPEPGKAITPEPEGEDDGSGTEKPPAAIELPEINVESQRSMLQDFLQQFQEAGSAFGGTLSASLGELSSSAGQFEAVFSSGTASIESAASSLSDLRDKRSNRETNGIDESIFSNEIPP